MVSGEKRNCDGENVLERINTILLDIEGTTTSINFVKETLFPYVRENLKAHVDSHWDDEEFKADLKALKQQAKKDEEDKVENFCPIEDGEKEKETLIKNVLWQMDQDRKTTALKQLQGHIWREGYENGKIKGHVYSEVAQVFKKWCEDGRKLYIYSSGSVEAQKLLFKNSESGDLLVFLSGHFDTEVGPKTEASSYTSIAKSLECNCDQILFLTDVVKEAVAADKAGMQVMMVIREGNAPLTDDEKKAFGTITSFNDLVFETSAKKKKICDDEKVPQQTEKAVNDEKGEKYSGVKNGELEKMEVEIFETKEDCKDEKTEETQPTKTESDGVKSESEVKNEAELDSIYIDVDDSNVEKESGEKAVSSSVNDNAETKTEEPTNGVADAVDEKPAGESETKTEPIGVSNTEKVDSTYETPVGNNAIENNAESKEMVEEPDGDENKENIKKAEEAVNKEEKTEDIKESDEIKETITATKGLENGVLNEGNGEEGASAEVNGATNNDKPEEIAETLPTKKVIPEEQADSTIEVTA